MYKISNEQPTTVDMCFPLGLTTECSFYSKFDRAVWLSDNNYSYDVITYGVESLFSLIF